MTYHIEVKNAHSGGYRPVLDASGIKTYNSVVKARKGLMKAIKSGEYGFCIMGSVLGSREGIGYTVGIVKFENGVWVWNDYRTNKATQLKADGTLGKSVRWNWRS